MRVRACVRTTPRTKLALRHGAHAWPCMHMHESTRKICAVETQTPCVREPVLSTVTWAGTGTGNLRPRVSALRSSEANALREWQPVLGRRGPCTVDVATVNGATTASAKEFKEVMIREVRAYRTVRVLTDVHLVALSSPNNLSFHAWRTPSASGIRISRCDAPRGSHVVLRSWTLNIHYSLFIDQG